MEYVKEMGLWKNIRKVLGLKGEWGRKNTVRFFFLGGGDKIMPPLLKPEMGTNILGIQNISVKKHCFLGSIQNICHYNLV